VNTADRSRVHERRLVLFLAGVQFVNVLGLMIVMPLGPDFARALGIPLDSLGTVAASYTLAAALAGSLGALFLDRFDRRAALTVALAGLALGTLASAWAHDLRTLLAARVVSGLFGGPAASLTLAILADVVAVERRGRALGVVMTSFSVAAVVGVPLGLRLAQLGGWQAPFLVTAALAAAMAVLALRALPPLRAHLEQPTLARTAEGSLPQGATLGALWELLTRPETLLAYASTAVAMLGAFLIIPNLSAFVQVNLGYPRDRLELLYGAGGIANFALLRAIGRWVDRAGSFRVSLAGTLALSAILWLGFARRDAALPAVVIFVVFMLSGALRNIANNTLSSRVPSADERARFTSLQSTIQHLASSTGASLSALVLTTGADGRLLHMDRLATLAILLCWLLPPLHWVLERRVRQRETAGRSRDAVGPSVATSGAR
jgi:predicted MFS family arabinose efflux permease